MQQTTNKLALVRPTYFNTYIEKRQSDDYFMDIHTKYHKSDVIKEFDELVHNLKTNKVNCTVYDAPMCTPDSVYPNNWISFHWETEEPTVIIYPMREKYRRRERLSDLLRETYISKLYKIIDLTYFEDYQLFLEGTGSLVLDRINKIAYCCLSNRTHFAVAKKWSEIMGYKIFSFHAYDQNGHVIYHTNVMMTIANHFTIVCLDSVHPQNERDNLIELLKKSSHKQIVTINMHQLEMFCGNCLQVRNNIGQHVLCLSEKAYNAFYPSQLEIIQKYCDGGFIITKYDTIEKVRGGSIRCSLLELYPS